MTLVTTMMPQHEETKHNIYRNMYKVELVKKWVANSRPSFFKSCRYPPYCVLLAMEVCEIAYWEKIDSSSNSQLIGYSSRYVSRVVKYRKSLCNICQHLSYQLDERITKISKKFNSNGGFLSYLLESTANPYLTAATFCLVLSALIKLLWELNFLHIFATPSSSTCEKCCKYFCCISPL